MSRRISSELRPGRPGVAGRPTSPPAAGSGWLPEVPPGPPPVAVPTPGALAVGSPLSELPSSTARVRFASSIACVGHRRRARLDGPVGEEAGDRRRRGGRAAASTKNPAQTLSSKKRSLSSQAKPCMNRISARKAKMPATMPTTEPLTSLLTFSRDLGLGELDLLADQGRGGLLGDVEDEVAERLVGGILLRAVVGCWLGHRLSRAGLRRRCAGRGSSRGARGDDAGERAGGGEQAAPDESFDDVVVHLVPIPVRSAAVNQLAVIPAARGRRRSSSTTSSLAWSKSVSEAGISSKIQPESSCSIAP